MPVGNQVQLLFPRRPLGYMGGGEKSRAGPAAMQAPRVDAHFEDGVGLDSKHGQTEAPPKIHHTA